MDRRDIILSGFAVTLRAFVPPLVSLPFAISSSNQAFAQNKLKVTGQLAKEYLKLANFLNWVDWAQSEVPTIADGKPPSKEPPGGACPVSISDSLVEFARAVDAMDISIDFPDISYPDAASLTLREIRTSNSSNFQLLSSAIIPLSDLSGVKVEVALRQHQLRERRRVLDELKEVFMKLASVPLPVVYQLAVSCWYTMETTYSKRFGNAISSLARLQKKVDAEIAAEKSNLVFAAGKHKVALESELQRIDYERGEQGKIRQLIEQLRTSMNEGISERAKLNTDRKNIEAEKLAGELDIEQIGVRIDELEQGIRSDRKRLKDARNGLQRKYNLCPNGAPYDRCNHTQQKSTWRARRKKLQGKVDSANRGISDKKRRIGNLRSEIPGLREYIKEKEQRLTVLAEAIALKHREISDIRLEMNAEQAALQKREAIAPVALLAQLNQHELNSLQSMRLE